MSAFKFTLTIGDPTAKGAETDQIFAGYSADAEAQLLAAVQAAAAGFAPEVVPIKLDYLGSDGTTVNIVNTEGTEPDAKKLISDLLPIFTAVGAP